MQIYRCGAAFDSNMDTLCCSEVSHCTGEFIFIFFSRGSWHFHVHAILIKFSALLLRIPVLVCFFFMVFPQLADRIHCDLIWFDLIWFDPIWYSSLFTEKFYFLKLLFLFHSSWLAAGMAIVLCDYTINGQLTFELAGYAVLKWRWRENQTKSVWLLLVTTGHICASKRTYLQLFQISLFSSPSGYVIEDIFKNL